MTTSKHFQFGFIALLFIGIFSSCKKGKEPIPQSLVRTRQMGNSEGITRLGKRLKNPYSVDNMQRAYNNIVNDSSINKLVSDEVVVKTTHLYVKFKPKNKKELSILKSDSSLTLYEYPLDYEIIEGGSYYHDPTLPDSIPTYLYASVEFGRVLHKEVAYEILSSLFIPDDESDDRYINLKSESKEFVALLITEALRITGNLEDATTSATLKSLKKSWVPAGRIMVYDNVRNIPIPLEGVEVRARRWFTTHTGITKPSGFYMCDGAFKRAVNYSIDWERYHFAIREGWLDGANYNGPKMEGHWVLYLDSGRQMYFARIFMAAFHYYYKDIKGLRRPPQNGTFKTQMHIRAFNRDDEDNGNHSAARRFLGLGSAIHIYKPDRAICDIYSTTIHELAHASHWSMDKDSYYKAEDKVVESWARGVQWELTRMVWSIYFGGGTNMPKYTQVVVDMIDPRVIPLPNTNYGFRDDGVTGYSILQIESSLLGTETWNQWKDNLKTRYNNDTEKNLDVLFQRWN